MLSAAGAQPWANASRRSRASSASTIWRLGATSEQLASLRERLGNEKLVVAFVAEFSRGKSELINAIFFADTGRRILPATPGRTTMCPVELGWRGDEPPSLMLLPIETRLEGLALGELRSAAARLAPPRARGQRSGTARRIAARGDAHRMGEPRAGARPRLLGRRRARRQPAARRRRPGRGAGLAPCAHQLPASAPQAGPGRPRHAGPERDRRRARADPGPAAVGARDRLHPRRRHRRHQVRPGDLARSPRRHAPTRASSC